MKSIVWIMGVALLIGCGGVVAPSGTGGATASSSSAPGDAASSSASGTGGVSGASSSGGGGGDLTTIGDPDCAFTWKNTAPIFGESTTTSTPHIPIDEDGALAAVRIVPPVYPWTATSVDYSLSVVSGICELLDHEVVAFVGPAGKDAPAHPVGAVVTPVLASGLVSKAGVAKATIPLAAPLVVHEGEDGWIGVKLRALSAAQRTCLRTCRGGGLDLASYWSPVDQQTGLSLQCPTNDCTLLPLSQSPNAVDAITNGNNDKRIVITAHGHP